MTACRRATLVTVALLLPGALTPAVAAAASASDPLRLKALALAYNLDHDAALALLEQAIAADPSHPAPYRTLAGVLWLHILFRRGAVTVDNYLGRVTRPTVPVDKPPADLDAQFHRQIDRALELAEARVRAAPTDPDAHYELGLASWLAASYTASVQGQLLAGFRAARRAYTAHEKVLALDPRRKDAAFVVGAYRYVVSTLSWPMRLLAYMAGFGGGRDEGIRLVEQAAAYPSDVQTQARFILVLLYNREGRYGDALRVLEDLQQQYPRNRLLWLEEGATALRAGDAGRAAAALERGLAMLAGDPRPRMFGEEALWRYKLGAARLRLGRLAEAAADLDAALAEQAPAWVRGRIHVELGKLADLGGDRPRARQHYQQAVALCETGRDGRCVEEATRLRDRGYTR
jgi:tetratricopeptide (TPR) repeat protein